MNRNSRFPAAECSNADVWRGGVPNPVATGSGGHRLASFVVLSAPAAPARRPRLAGTADLHPVRCMRVSKASPIRSDCRGTEATATQATGYVFRSELFAPQPQPRSDWSATSTLGIRVNAAER